MKMSDIVAVAHTLAQTLETLGVVYWIGGSMPSAIHGLPRSTQDVDFVAELKEEQVDDLVAALESEFYIDREVVRRAVRSRRSFNVTRCIKRMCLCWEQTAVPRQRSSGAELNR